MKSDCAQSGDRLHLMQERLVRMIRHPRGAVTLPRLLDGEHGAEQAELAVAAIKRGLVPIRLRGAGTVTTFAEACCVLGRVDVLRAVVEIGLPGWEFKGREHTRRDWLEELCSYRRSDSDDDRVSRSLYQAATSPRGAHTREAFVLALEYQPHHPDLEAVRDQMPICAAILAEAEMCLRLRQVMSAASASASPQAAPARRMKAL